MDERPRLSLNVLRLLEMNYVEQVAAMAAALAKVWAFADPGEGQQVADFHIKEASDLVLGLAGMGVVLGEIDLSGKVENEALLRIWLRESSI